MNNIIVFNIQLKNFQPAVDHNLKHCFKYFSSFFSETCNLILDHKLKHCLENILFIFFQKLATCCGPQPKTLSQKYFQVFFSGTSEPKTLSQKIIGNI